MTVLAKKIVAACPAEWTDLRDCARLFPAQAPGPMAIILEDLEKSGEIEVRQFGNPPRVQVRKKAKL